MEVLAYGVNGPGFHGDFFKLHARRGFGRLLMGAGTGVHVEGFWFGVGEVGKIGKNQLGLGG